MFYFKKGHIVIHRGTEGRYIIGTVSQVLRGEQGQGGVKIEVTTPAGVVHQLEPRAVRPVINIILGKDRKIKQLTAFRYQATELLKKIASGEKYNPTELNKLLKFFEPKYNTESQ